ncbi:YitT family protein [Mycoplasma todarodis]|uniref:YitT family protein n=1 Tax=Mycoplasma todarodis TaxID=1937191 RepID=UPI003B31FCAB
MNKILVKKWTGIILILIISSFLFSFGLKMFVSSAKTFSSGLGALPQFLTYITDLDQKYFSILYFAFNIPFLIVFFFLVRKKFIILTFVWLLFQLSWGQLMEVIPGISDADPFHIGKWAVAQEGKETTVGLVKEKWAIIVQPCVGAVITGTGTALAWKTGGSSGGADVITYYISTRKQKSPGVVATLVSLSIALTMIVIQTIMKNVPVGDDPAQMLFGPITWGTLGYIFISSTILSKIYPRYKKVEVVISSTKVDQIVTYFKHTGYVHGYNVSMMKSGFTGKNVKTIRTVMLFLELKPIIKKLREIDPNVWISTTVVAGIIGNFNHKSVE